MDEFGHFVYVFHRCSSFTLKQASQTQVNNIEFGFISKENAFGELQMLLL